MDVVSDITDVYNSANTATPTRATAIAMLYDAIRQAIFLFYFQVAAQQVDSYLAGC